jgi:hypothetical protein
MRHEDIGIQGLADVTLDGAEGRGACEILVGQPVDAGGYAADGPGWPDQSAGRVPDDAIDDRHDGYLHQFGWLLAVALHIDDRITHARPVSHPLLLPSIRSPRGRDARHGAVPHVVYEEVKRVLEVIARLRAR